MMRPKREVATSNQQTYFVTSSTCDRQCFFRNERWAVLFVETLLSYRPDKFELHAFVLMPDHFHVLITPGESLEKAVQFIKGGFSFRAKRELGWKGEIWAAGFSDHRIRDAADCAVHQRYVDRNPVKAGMVEGAGSYRYGSASGKYLLDELPRGLKPQSVVGTNGGAEAPPFQNEGDLVKGIASARGQVRSDVDSEKYLLDELPRGLKPQSVVGTNGGAETPPFQNKSARCDAAGASIQHKSELESGNGHDAA